MSRFAVTYRIFAASEVEARERAQGIALEQTVEIPMDVVPAGYIADEIVGQVEEIGPEGDGRFRARISYAPDAAGPDLPQLLNVIFGNSSIQKGIKVVGLDLGALGTRYPGPRFGIEGVRRLCATPNGPMVAPVLKPMGTSPQGLAAIADRTVRAGAQIIKEDHGLADQPTAPFEARVPVIAEAVARANEETGQSALYFAALSGPVDGVLRRAYLAKEMGATGLLVMPGLVGFDVVRALADAPDLGLPVMTHPSFLGPYVLSEDTGFSHGVMFGVLQRLAGSDISVFPNVGGRFGFSIGDCQDIARACQSSDGIGQPMLPSPGGGMSIERGREMQKMYGDDTVFLLGGSLLRAGEEIGDAIRSLMSSLA